MVAVVADDEDVMRPREEGVGGAHLMCDDSPETFGGEESSGIHPWHLFAWKRRLEYSFDSRDAPF